MSDELNERVKQFNAMQLPGQPMAMHMGTSYLVNDLHKRITELEIALNHIANEFMTTEEILNDCESMGLTYEEYLEMSYENIQGVAQAALSEGEK